MQRANPNALIGSDGDVDVMIEDSTDPDGRIYRMEYQSTPDGRHATAFCRFNPWGPLDGGAILGHIFSDGSLCIGGKSGGHGGPAKNSSYDLETVIQRARYWCTAFSVFQETGRFPQP
jgi:hypothetical protein